jgi:AP-4 complex subunit mu-1
VHRAAETYFHAIQVVNAAGAGESQEEPPPVFELDGVTYVCVKTSGLHFLATTKFNVSANLVLELLARLAKSFRDFCGILSEEAIRKNFVLVYELLDEVMDFGYAQQTSTEALKQFVYNEPVPVSSTASAFKVPTMSSARGRIAPSFSINKSVLTPARSSGVGGTLSSRFTPTGSRNEIFVDIVEKITCLFNATGSLLNSEVDGSIIMKSFLTNNPELRVALNEDLVLGKHLGLYAGGVVLDDANFHECVKLDEFEEARTLVFLPPEGEFVLMNYRVTGDVRPPFRISPSFEQISPTQLELFIRVRADIPQRNVASSVKVMFPVPSKASGVSLTTGRGADAQGQSAEYLPKDSRVVWTIKKFQGGSEHALRARVTLKEAGGPNVRREMGPISMEFDIPMLSMSNLQVRYLRISQQSQQQQQKGQGPHRWVRYITQSASYACRLTG